MEVTRTNFRDLLPQINEVIKESTFLALDGEFTGLHNGEGHTAFETPAQYYQKIRCGFMDFLFFQFGLAAFKFDPSTKKYTHHAFNFYLFPRPRCRQAKDYRFLCQSSSLDFLANNGFDFNKVFKEGIPFLNQPDEEEARLQLEERRNRTNKEENESIPVPTELKGCVENACLQIREFLSSDKVEQELILEKSHGFSRKLVYQAAKTIFTPEELTLETRNNTVLVALRGKEAEDRRKDEAERREREDMEIEDAVGFSHVIRMISESNKLVIGHNLLLDLCHIIRQFYMPLPEEYEDFKDMLHCIFPNLIDTKYMCVTPPFKDILNGSVLVNIIPTIKAPPFSLPEVDCEEGKGYKSLDEKLHEAGFDAFITGLVFISLGNYLLETKGKRNSSVAITDTPFLKPFINRLKMMRMPDTYMNLLGPDPIPDRDNVFYLEFPKNWKYNDIYKLFNPYGNIFISWINDTSAWVSLHNKDQSANVKRTLLTNNTLNVRIKTFAAYNESSNKSQTKMKDGGGAVHHGFSPPTTSAARKRRSDPLKTHEDLSKRRKSRSLGKEYGNSSTNSAVPTIPEQKASNNKTKHKKSNPEEAIHAVEVEQKRGANPEKQFDEEDSWD